VPNAWSIGAPKAPFESRVSITRQGAIGTKTEPAGSCEPMSCISPALVVLLMVRSPPLLLPCELDRVGSSQLVSGISPQPLWLRCARSDDGANAKTAIISVARKALSMAAPPGLRFLRADCCCFEVSLIYFSPYKKVRAVRLDLWTDEPFSPGGVTGLSETVAKEGSRHRIFLLTVSFSSVRA
jgi:hypothetical protein